MSLNSLVVAATLVVITCTSSQQTQRAGITATRPDRYCESGRPPAQHACQPHAVSHNLPSVRTWPVNGELINQRHGDNQFNSPPPRSNMALLSACSGTRWEAASDRRGSAPEEAPQLRLNRWLLLNTLSVEVITRGSLQIGWNTIPPTPHPNPPQYPPFTPH